MSSVNNRMVKFSKDGTFINAWGKKGTGPGEFNLPHSIFFDSRGRLLVVDRSNKRIQIFDQDATFLEQWPQFGEASGIFITKDDTLYVTDWQDKKAIFIGSAKGGLIKTRLEGLTLAEGLTVDAEGNIYAAETLPGQIGDLVTGANIQKNRQELSLRKGPLGAPRIFCQWRRSVAVYKSFANFSHVENLPSLDTPSRRF